MKAIATTRVLRWVSLPAWVACYVIGYQFAQLSEANLMDWLANTRNFTNELSWFTKQVGGLVYLVDYWFAVAWAAITILLVISWGALAIQWGVRRIANARSR